MGDITFTAPKNEGKREFPTETRTFRSANVFSTPEIFDFLEPLRNDPRFDLKGPFLFKVLKAQNRGQVTGSRLPVGSKAAIFL